MVRIGMCIPCQMGNHARHHKTIQAVPKGMLGGATCGCKGECEDNADERRREFLRQQGLAPRLHGKQHS
jgi:hypothetical protein